MNRESAPYLISYRGLLLSFLLIFPFQDLHSAKITDSTFFLSLHLNRRNIELRQNLHSLPEANLPKRYLISSSFLMNRQIVHSQDVAVAMNLGFNIRTMRADMPISTPTTASQSIGNEMFIPGLQFGFNLEKDLYTSKRKRFTLGYGFNGIVNILHKVRRHKVISSEGGDMIFELDLENTIYLNTLFELAINPAENPKGFRYGVRYINRNNTNKLYANYTVYEEGKSIYRGYIMDNRSQLEFFVGKSLLGM